MMKNIRLVWVLVVAALVGALTVPMAANAAVGATFSSTPSAAAGLNAGDAATLATTLDLPTNSTLNASMEQNWPAGKAVIGDITSPDGWSLEYKVNGSWTSTLPTDMSTVSGVRSQINGLVTGAGSVNGTQAIANAQSSAIVGDPGSINASGRGDGWNVFLTPKYILNVYHHDSDYRLECHFRTDGNLCDPANVYTVAGYETGRGSGGVYYQGKVYSAVANSGHLDLICTNVAALPFTSCGVTVLDAVGAPDGAQSNIGTQVFDGTHVYVASTASGKLSCYNVKTQAVCGPYASSIGRSNADIAAFSSYIQGKVFTMADKLYCFDTITNQACAGAWPQTVSNGGSQTGVIPKRATNGIITGVCTITDDFLCFNLQGIAVTMPSTLKTMLTTNDTAVRAGNGYFQTTAWTNTRQFWASNPNGTSWSDGHPQCFDWVTEAACADFDTSTFIGGSVYSLSVATPNSNCVWVNGDSGNIYIFSAITGANGCPSTTTKAAVNYNTLPRTSCSNLTGYVRNFQRLDVSLPETSTFDPANLRVSVFNGIGQAVTGFQNLPLVAGSVSLSGLNVADTSSNFTFIIQSVDDATYTLNPDDAAAISTQLYYDADPVQLCVQLSYIVPVCPATLGTKPIPQPDITTTASATYQVNGSSAVTSNSSTTFHVNPAPLEKCYIWKSFFNPDNYGISPNSDPWSTWINAIAFGPDGKMYVGGNLFDAGNNPAADYLAAWDGTNWLSVGSSDGTTPALNSSVRAIAFTADGKIVVGGYFTNAGGSGADYLAVYNPKSKTWSRMANNPSDPVNSIVINKKGIAYVGTGSGNNVYAYNIKSGASVPISALNGWVNKLALDSKDQLYAVGGMSGAFVKYDAKTNTWSNGSTAANQNTDYIKDSAVDLAIYKDKIYVVGYYNGVATLDTKAQTWSWLGGNSTMHYNYAVGVDSTGKVYVGGMFDSVGDLETYDVTMWNGTAFKNFPDARNMSMHMSNACGEGCWGVGTVAISPNDVAIWGGSQYDCADRSELDYLCYFGDKVQLKAANIADPDSPYVTNQTPFEENVKGGDKLTITGHLLGKTSEVLIDGKPAQIVSVTNDKVVIILPAGTVGVKDLLLNFSDKTFTYHSHVTYVNPRKPVSTSVGGFAPGSSVLTSDMKASIKAFMKKYSDYKVITCTGVTMGPTVLATDKALAQNRAKNGCNYAISVLSGLAVAPYQDAQETNLGSAIRRIIITLSDN